MAKTSSEGAGHLTCPLKKSFTKDQWCELFEDADFSAKAWALAFSVKPVNILGKKTVQDESGDEE